MVALSRIKPEWGRDEVDDEVARDNGSRVISYACAMRSSRIQALAYIPRDRLRPDLERLV